MMKYLYIKLLFFYISFNIVAEEYICHEHYGNYTKNEKFMSHKNKCHICTCVDKHKVECFNYQYCNELQCRKNLTYELQCCKSLKCDGFYINIFS